MLCHHVFGIPTARSTFVPSILPSSPGPMRCTFVTNITIPPGLSHEDEKKTLKEKQQEVVALQTFSGCISCVFALTDVVVVAGMYVGAAFCLGRRGLIGFLAWPLCGGFLYSLSRWQTAAMWLIRGLSIIKAAKTNRKFSFYLGNSLFCANRPLARVHTLSGTRTFETRWTDGIYEKY